MQRHSGAGKAGRRFGLSTRAVSPVLMIGSPVAGRTRMAASTLPAWPARLQPRERGVNRTNSLVKCSLRTSATPSSRSALRLRRRSPASDQPQRGFMAGTPAYSLSSAGRPSRVRPARLSQPLGVHGAPKRISTAPPPANPVCRQATAAGTIAAPARRASRTAAPQPSSARKAASNPPQRSQASPSRQRPHVDRRRPPASHGSQAMKARPQVRRRGDKLVGHHLDVGPDFIEQHGSGQRRKCAVRRTGGHQDRTGHGYLFEVPPFAEGRPSRRPGEDRGPEFGRSPVRWRRDSGRGR